MASTSPLLMVFSQETNTTGSKGQGGSSNNNQDASKSSEQPSSKLPRGRKPNKSSSKSPLYKNKPKRRGMGVEKLERWLQAEKWGGGDHNLPAEVASVFPLHPHHQFQTPTPPHVIPVAASPSVYVVGSDSLMSKSSSSSSFMAASSKVISTFGGACGKELSSIPKEMQCHQCDASCYYSKNKCMNMEEMHGINLGGMNHNKLVFPSSLINDCHMLTAGHNNVGLEMKDLNSRFMKQMVYNQDSDYQLMGSFARQAASSSCSTDLKEYEFFPPGKGLREYEFFPGTNSGRSYARSSEQPNHYYYYSEPAAASSYLIPSSDFSQYHAASATNSNALDLSLKL